MPMLAPPIPRMKPMLTQQQQPQQAPAPTAPPPEPFVWGEGGTKMTPADVAKRKQIAQAMMQEGASYAPVQHWTQGLARVAQALAGGLEERRANDAETEGRAHFKDQLAQLLAAQGAPGADMNALRPQAFAAMDDPYATEGARAMLAQQVTPKEQWTPQDVNNDGVPDRQVNSLTGEMKAVGEPALSFDQKLELARQGASRTNVTYAGERAFDKGVGEAQAKQFGEMATEGINAKSDMSMVNELETNIGKLPGGLVGGLQGFAASWGIEVGKGAGAAQAANAIISKLVPQQRTPGSGQMSDRDVNLFKESLPRLINNPEGNSIIIGTMKAMAKFKMDQAKIANAAMTGQISRAEATQAIGNLPDPMDAFKATLGPRQTFSAPNMSGGSDEAEIDAILSGGRR